MSRSQSAFTQVKGTEQANHFYPTIGDEMLEDIMTVAELKSIGLFLHSFSLFSRQFPLTRISVSLCSNCLFIGPLSKSIQFHFQKDAFVLLSLFCLRKRPLT